VTIAVMRPGAVVPAWPVSDRRWRWRARPVIEVGKRDSRQAAADGFLDGAQAFLFFGLRPA
jgi:hypothetical protein